MKAVLEVFIKILMTMLVFTLIIGAIVTSKFWLGFFIGMPIWGSIGILLIALVIGGNRE